MFVVCKNTGGTSCNVGFTQNGAAGIGGSNYFSLGPGESFAGDFRISQLYVSGSSTYSVSVLAGLTAIPVGNMPLITGSNGFQGVG
jgi:hypothetical protein